LPVTNTIVAFQGEPGAYSEEAIRKHYGNEVETLPCHTFEEIFEAVLSDQATAGILPVENSLAGTVAHSYELLLEHDLRVQAELVLRVRHMLLAPPGITLQDVERVQSHPQALAQCEGFIRRRGWQSVPAYDTAGSARELAANPQPGTAVIASALAGELYGLDLLEREIEDQTVNSTRFFIVGHDDAPYQPDIPQKTSVVFAVGHQPASLYHCLGVFAENEINLTKLESRPMRSRPWQYWFYLDFEGHINEPRCEQALAGLLGKASMIKFLGSYPAAPRSNENGLAANGVP
jgi:prephenate dehydratase